MNNQINKLFSQKLSDGEVVKWYKKSNNYAKYKKRFEIYQGKIFALVHSRLSETEYKIFGKLLEGLKGSIYDLELVEKEYYYKEGYKEGIKLMKELFK